MFVEDYAIFVYFEEFFQYLSKTSLVNQEDDHAFSWNYFKYIKPEF